ncbi:glutathione ABC transporter substrate-binding protein [Aliicoccus persicus]|uniref:Peptide/nickel transport system substrate-binding protein n=1 Tax=Aliicoccus persicus TaxID=930138 RepID=A0A662Z3P8_9STAP|nr:glutathione ABC transporter substrate-binding protein [Aliicoccus persicus]SEV94270.1 peptide/nickel transport system substrate-binding protein [Aliicoccus persicus]
MNKLRLFLLLIISTVVLIACNTDDAEDDVEEEVTEEESTEENSEETEDESTDDEASTEDEDGLDLNLSFLALPNSLDPHAANDGYSLYVMVNIYETLVRLNEDLELEPALAESYEQIDDTTWEFVLREDVEFHDGEPFNAEAVKVNLDRVLDEDIGSPLAFLFTEIDEVEVVDEYTVHITTHQPFAALPSHLAHPGGHMISPAVIEADYAAMEDGAAPLTEVNRNPVGTGFFKFESIAEGDNIVLVRNEDYWGEPAAPSSVTFRAVPEDGARVAELTTGNADLIYPTNPQDVPQINESETAIAREADSANMTYLGFNTEVEPFDDPVVRQAIAMAIDKEVIIEELLEGIALKAETPLNPTVNAHSEDIEPIEYNMDAARELLEENGYEDGFSAEVIMNNRTHADVATFIQEALSELNIELSISQVEAGTFQEYAATGNFEMLMGGWGTVTLDGDYGLYPMFHSDNIGAPGNRTRYSNEEVDELLDLARVETDEETRFQYYHDAQQIIVDEAPLVPIYHTVLISGIQEDLLDDYFQFPSSFPYIKNLTRD